MKLESCRGCGADIVWLKTAEGKSMPVNAETVEAGDQQFEHGRHISHFATCPEAGMFRKKK